MISTQLAFILHDYASRESQLEVIVRNNKCVLVTRDGKFSVTVASVPDSETVMLFGKVGVLPDGDDSSEAEWIVAETGIEGRDFSQSDLHCKPTVAFDKRSRTLALTDSASAALLDAVAFDRWTAQFLEELALTAEVFDEVVIEAEETGPRPKPASVEMLTLLP